MEESNVLKVGDITNPNAKRIRVVHISDTHLQHDTLLPHVPDGDVLIHSGDFGKFHFRTFFTGVNHHHLLDKIDQFFQNLPHRHKIFVAGNHETTFNNKSREEIQTALQHVHYLQDSSITCEGLNIYGSPWNSQRWTSYARGFTKPWGKFEKHWDKIPEDTDILVTHMPPQGIRDLAHIKFPFLTSQPDVCRLCSSSHRNMSHWGCPRLKNVILEKVQ